MINGIFMRNQYISEKSLLEIELKPIDGTQIIQQVKGYESLRMHTIRKLFKRFNEDNIIV